MCFHPAPFQMQHPHISERLGVRSTILPTVVSICQAMFVLISKVFVWKTWKIKLDFQVNIFCFYFVCDCLTHLYTWTNFVDEIKNSDLAMWMFRILSKSFTVLLHTTILFQFARIYTQLIPIGTYCYNVLSTIFWPVNASFSTELALHIWLNGAVQSLRLAIIGTNTHTSGPFALPLFHTCNRSEGYWLSSKPVYLHHWNFWQKGENDSSFAQVEVTMDRATGTLI